MPINYMPQAPIAGAYAASYALGAAQNAARSRSSGGGGFSYGEVNPAVLSRMFEGDADRTQAAIANRDRQAFEIERYNSEMGQRPILANVQAQNEAGLSAMRIAGQIALQNNELSQQERIRYMRMKNAMGAIEADPTWTEDEKAAMRLQIQTGINPYEQRIAKERLDTEIKQKEAWIEAKQAQTNAENMRLKLLSGDMDSRLQVRAKTDAIAPLREEILDLHPELDPNGEKFRMFTTDPPEVQKQKFEAKQAAEKTLKNIIDQEAAKRGMAERWIMDEKGNLTLLDESKFGDVGKNAPGRGRPGQQQLTARDYLSIEEQVDKAITDGSVPAADRQKEIAERWGRLNSAVNPPVAAVAKPAPFTSIEQASEKQKIRIDEHARILQNLLSTPGVTQQEINRITGILTDANKLFAKYSSEDGTLSAAPESIQKKMRSHQNALRKYDTAAPVAPSQATDAGAATAAGKPLPPGSKDALGKPALREKPDRIFIPGMGYIKKDSAGVTKNGNFFPGIGTIYEDENGNVVGVELIGRHK